MGTGLTCNACNKEFNDDSDQKLHYKSDWHRYNLKRKIAGVPGVTEALFLARQSALAEEKKSVNETPMLYSCGICDKGYRSAKAHAQHLNSKSHIMQASQSDNQQNAANTIIKPLPRRAPVQPPRAAVLEAEDSEESEWEEDDPDKALDEATSSLSNIGVNGHSAENDSEDTDEDDEMMDDFDPSCCFMCDLEHKTIESCMVHMHKKHGFFIPDVDYLKDPKGLLTYLGLKVKRDFMCLYCNERVHPFSSLEAVRKHMEAKSHCKVPFGDGGDEEEVELEEFYDYSSSYMDEDGKQLVAENDMGDSTVELGGGGSELVIKRRTDDGMSTKAIGSREFLRYYKQKPKPSRPANEIAITAELSSRYRSMGLATVQSREQIVRMKVLKQMHKSGPEAVRTRIGMKNNVIWNLPRNVPY